MTCERCAQAETSCVFPETPTVSEELRPEWQESERTVDGLETKSGKRKRPKVTFGIEESFKSEEPALKRQKQQMAEGPESIFGMTDPADIRQVSRFIASMNNLSAELKRLVIRLRRPRKQKADRMNGGWKEDNNK